MILLAPDYPPAPGESAAARICRIVRSYAGCSLSHDRERLAALVGRGVDDASVVTWRTNCLTFSLGVLAAAGCPDLVLRKPLRNGREGEVIAAIAEAHGGWLDPQKEGPPVPGSLIWYEIAGENDDHYEWELDGGEHGGGGRTDNEITIERGPVTLSLGRPIRGWLHPEQLGLPDASTTTADPTQTIPVPADAMRDTVPPPTDPDATHRAE